MPQVKINYIVSFSSEDPEHPASGLLEREVGRRRWLARAGESPASVVLQLEKAVKIGSVSIGAHMTALVEVLVGRSETPNDPFEVLVPSSVFQSPAEVRRAGSAGVGAAGAAERVRSFPSDALAAPARAQRWDRLRVVCTQPYNKHCKFGLSFVHVFSEEQPPAAPAPAPAAPAAPARSPSTDDEEFRPGELFARHRAAASAATAGDTGAQIRQATSHAMNNIPDSSVKLTKTPITKPSERRRGERDARASETERVERAARASETERVERAARASETERVERAARASETERVERAARASETERAADRGRDALLYTADDGRPPDSARHNGKHKNTTQKHDDKQANTNKTQRPDDKQANTNKTQRPDDKQANTNKTQRPDDKQANTNKTQRHDDKQEHANKQRHETHRGDGPSGSGTAGPSTRDDKDSGTRDRDTPAADRRRGEGRSEPRGDGAGGAAGRKRRRGDGADRRDRQPAPPPPHTLLAGVVLVLSGYQNPRRARLRTAALALGAAARADWGPGCTHLICAFPNTPKLRAVRAGPGGARALVVLGEWVEECARTRRRLPEAWFATEPARRRDPPPGWDDEPADDARDAGGSGSDTDDEIERVRQKMKKRPAAPSPPPSPRGPPAPGRARSRSRSPAPARDLSGASAGDDVVFVKDDRMQGEVTVVESDDSYGGSTDEEPAPAAGPGETGPGAGGRLPALFAGLSFAVSAGADSAARLTRYLRAYGGLVLTEPESDVDYVVCDPRSRPPPRPRPQGPAGARVSAAWLWRCHAARRRADPEPGELLGPDD